MSIKSDPSYRLNLFWGRVDQKQIDSFLPYIKRGRVLDLGCGLGNTSKLLSSNSGLEIVGLDYSQEEITKAKNIFPDLNIVFGNAEDMPFERESFDTLVLKDSLHHFYQEADFQKVSSEINRVLKPGGRLIFLDPNVNAMIKFLRNLSGHADAECCFEEAIEIVNDLRYAILKKDFHTLFSLPLSGGYVYKNFIPHNHTLYNILINAENIIEKPINALNLGRVFVLAIFNSKRKA